MARKICGWISQINDVAEGGPDEDDADDITAEIEADEFEQELSALVAECEMIDSFERACAIALFHGNVSMAVKVHICICFDYLFVAWLVINKRIILLKTDFREVYAQGF